MSGTAPFVLSDVLPYLTGILGLFLLWQYHEKQVLTGRIQAIDIFDRSGIRMYLFATPDNDSTCEPCREMNGMAFLPSRVAGKDSASHRKPCTNGNKCTVVMVGLYGAWVEARAALERLRAARNTGVVRLESDKLLGLIKGKWESSVSAATDRLSVVMLAALASERATPEAALAGYLKVIQEAKEVRHLPLVVPAYIRLTEVLMTMGQSDEARAVIQEFEDRYPRQGKSGPYGPNEIERGLMTIKKSRLKTAPAVVKV